MFRRFISIVFGIVLTSPLSVVDQAVKTLIDGEMVAGAHEIMWDSRSDGGGQVASGVYFYRLEAGHFIDTRKTVLLKW